MTALVFLPGMMCDARLFEPQIAALSAHHTLHCATLNSHDTVCGLAEAVLANAPPTFALAGLSMGGIVAMEIVAQARDRITHLALLDTNPRAELPEVQARRAPQIEQVRAGGLRAVMRDEMKPNYLIESPRKTAIMELCMEMAEAIGPDVFIRQSRALRDRPDQQETLRGVTVPTLILCGAQDQLCPVERHERMHELIPHSTLTIVQDAAHLPTLEQPEAVNASLINWLESA